MSLPDGAPPTPPMLQFTIQGGAQADGSVRPDIDVAVMSLARYTFADPAAAARGPALLEPPVQQQRAAGAAAGGGFGPIAEFTEERINAHLARVARRLLLPHAHVAACYDLHQVLGVGALLDVEHVQRNVFKCLKICARLSKLPGYGVQLLWQVIHAAHSRIDGFAPERARTIALWHTKLTNRIRLMAVMPASDGSAPPRLPAVPPPELLQAHAREKLLPLPAIDVAALTEAAFNRANGVSGAAHYLAHPLRSSRPSNDATLPSVSLPAADDADSAGIDPEQDPAPPARETELAIIEYQLRELENVPAHRMGPMLRAALNLLVEMRFRLQLGLPRQTLTSDNLDATTAAAAAAAASAGGENQIAGSASAAPARLDEEEARVIGYVLDQISTSRRQRIQARAVASSNRADGFGSPLYMWPRQAGLYNQPMVRTMGYSAYDHSTRSLERSRRRPHTDSESGSETGLELLSSHEESAFDDSSTDHEVYRRRRSRRRINET